MSADPADLAAPRDPADYRRPRGRGLRLGGVLAFGAVCMIGGGALATLAPKLLAGRPAARLWVEPAPAPAPPAPAVAGPAPTPAPAVEPAASSADLARLNARLAALESQENRTSQAAVSALAAAAVVEAAQSSRPFPEELAALRAAAPAAPELAALTRLAETGVPSRAALAASFPDYAARAIAANHKPAEGASFGDRVVYALFQIVSLRRVGEAAGQGVDGQIAAAERLVEDGDIDAALRHLDKLSPAAQAALSPWRARAERRAEVDRLAAAIRGRALRDLSGLGPAS